MLNTDATIRNLILEGHFDKINTLLEGGIDGASYSFNKDLYRLIKARPDQQGRRRALLAEPAAARDEPEGYLHQELGGGPTIPMRASGAIIVVLLAAAARAADPTPAPDSIAAAKKDLAAIKAPASAGRQRQPSGRGHEGPRARSRSRRSGTLAPC